jgi:hypothetical protein
MLTIMGSEMIQNPFLPTTVCPRALAFISSRRHLTSSRYVRSRDNERIPEPEDLPLSTMIVLLALEGTASRAVEW